MIEDVDTFAAQILLDNPGKNPLELIMLAVRLRDERVAAECQRRAYEALQEADECAVNHSSEGVALSDGRAAALFSMASLLNNESTCL